MNDIRAFVGHSFSTEDAGVVGEFLKYFDQLKKSHSNFSWVHAEEAEPKEVAEKVIALLEGCNVFIGICTRKEYVIAPSVLSKQFFRRKYLQADASKFRWKISDWIMQEIGLAIGKGLSLILLVEDGVEISPGLQGNIEYIPFKREILGEPFVKFLQMITSLSPKISEVHVASAETRATADEETIADSSSDQWWKTPKPNWDRINYEFAYWRAIRDSDTEAMTLLSDAYLESEEGRKPEGRNSWGAYVEYQKMLGGSGGTLAHLRYLALAHPESADVQKYLAQGYSHFHEYVRAADTYENAAIQSNSVEQRQEMLGYALIQRARAGQNDLVNSLVGEIKALAKGADISERRLLDVLKELSELRGDNESQLALMERIVEIDPGDTDARFALAFKHSRCGNDDLALFHYATIPASQRSSIAWNNLGAALDALALPIKSVEAYRRSIELNQTLAMNNIANKFLAAGFTREAQEECDRALKIEDYHENVGRTLVALRTRPAEEDRREREISTKAKPKSEFYRFLGRAVSELEPVWTEGSWKGPDCVLDTKITGSEIEFFGSYEVQPSPLASAFTQGTIFGLAARPAPIPYRIEYSGIVKGSAIEGHVVRFPANQRPQRRGLLASSGDEVKVLMVLIGDSVLRVMEIPGTGDPRFYMFTKQ